MGFDLYDAVREEEVEKNYALVAKLSQEDSWVRQELLWVIWQADPSVFVNIQKWHLRVVSDEKRRAVEKLLGTSIATLQDSTKTWLILPDKLVDLNTPTHIEDTEAMSEAEFSLFSALYFSDSKAREMLVKLFMTEKDSQWSNFTLDLNNLYEEIFEEEPTNIHSFWTTEKKDSLKIRLNRLISGERKRLYEYVYSYAKVRKKHGRFWNSFFLRLAKTLWWHTWLRQTQVVDFPGEYNKSTQQDQEVQTKKLRSDTPEIVSKAFITGMIVISKLPENIEWYTGVRTQVFIPNEIQKQFERMQELEVLWWLYNYHEHIESTLAMLIGYYYPAMVSKYGLQKWKDISAKQLEKYPSIEDVHISLNNNSVHNNTQREKYWKTDAIILEMNEKVAEHFWFPLNSKLRCSPQLIEHILWLPDEEPVVFDIWWKQAQISAKMFRRIFHRGTLPSKDEVDNIIPFTQKI